LQGSNEVRSLCPKPDSGKPIGDLYQDEFCRNKASCVRRELLFPLDSGSVPLVTSIHKSIDVGLV
jgi:hypothetical protein